MSKWFAQLFRETGEHDAHGKTDRFYVSEFTGFIDHYLEDHPDVVEDQEIGRDIYWDKMVDFSALKQAEQDAVPDDGYGFYHSAWGRADRTQTPRAPGSK